MSRAAAAAAEEISVKAVAFYFLSFATAMKWQKSENDQSALKGSTDHILNEQVDLHY